MTKEQLQALIDEYVGTLDDEKCTEYFQTDRDYARAELSGFMEWLAKRTAVEPSGDDEARITEMTFKAKAGEPIEAYAQFEGGPVKAFAISLVQWFRESGGENYVTCDLRDPTTGEAYSITMQKAGGRTPAQDLCELRSQLNRTGD